MRTRLAAGLGAVVASSMACTSLLGGFDFDGKGTGGAGGTNPTVSSASASSSSSSGSSTTTGGSSSMSASSSSTSSSSSATSSSSSSGSPCTGGEVECNGTCVDTQTDDSNCGGCGLTCTNCTAGECIVVLASNVPKATGIVLNGIKAYVTSSSQSGAIYSTSLSGGSASVTNLTQGYPQSYPYGVAVDSTYVYWTNGDGSVMRMPLGGAVKPTQVASGQANPWMMAIDATNLYWTNNGTPGTVMKMNLSSLVVSTLVGGLMDPTGIAVDSTYAYVADTGDDYVIKVQLSNGTIASQLTNFQNNPFALAIDSKNVYFTNQANSGDAHQVAQNASNSAGISLGSSNIPSGIATDGTNVYYAGDALYKCPVGVSNGCKVLAMESAVSFVAVDATSVYWTNATAGTVKRITPK